MDRGLAELIKSGFIDLKFNHAYHEYRMKHEQGNQYLTREISELFDIAKKLEGVDVCYDLGEKTPTLLFKGVPLSQVDALRKGSTIDGTGEFLFYATEYMRSVNAWSEKTPEGNSVFAILNPDNRYRMVKTDNRLSCFTGDEYVTEERISPSDIIYVPTKEEIDRLNLRSRK